MKRIITGCGLIALLIIGVGCKQLVTPPGGEPMMPGGKKPSTPSNTPRVTRQNFSSLAMHTSGGIANIKVQLVVRYNRSRLYGFLGAGWSLQEWRGNKQVLANFGPLSDAEYGAIVRLLSDIQFPKLSGKYHQKGLRDGINEKVILTLLQRDEKRQKFIVENYGNAAPQSYYKLVNHLYRLINRLKSEPEGEVLGGPGPLAGSPKSYRAP